jgi:purine-cytosine permease-like protein
VGAVTTIVALFPALMMRLLDFVALYGLLLMPMGAVIFADFWLLPRLGLQQDWAERRQLRWAWPAAAAWLVTLGACLLLNLAAGVQIFFLGLPGWFIAIALYVALSYAQQRAARTAPGPLVREQS